MSGHVCFAECVLTVYPCQTEIVVTDNQTEKIYLGRHHMGSRTVACLVLQQSPLIG